MFFSEMDEKITNTHPFIFQQAVQYETQIKSSTLVDGKNITCLPPAQDRPLKIKQPTGHLLSTTVEFSVTVQILDTCAESIPWNHAAYKHMWPPLHNGFEGDFLECPNTVVLTESNLQLTRFTCSCSYGKCEYVIYRLQSSCVQLCEINIVGQ